MLTLTSREARVYEGVFAGADATPRRLELLPLGNGSAAAGLISRADAVTPEIIQPHRVQLGMGPTGKSDTRYVHGGFRAKQDDMDIDTEIFFRHVDELVHETISRQTELPLVLVALPELAAVFRGLSKNRMLLADYVPHDPALFSADDLATRVMPIFDAARQRRIAHAVRLFEQAHDRGLAATDLADVARAAVAGKVATLLIEADRFETGRLDRGTGAIEFNGEHPGDLSRTGISRRYSRKISTARWRRRCSSTAAASSPSTASRCPPQAASPRSTGIDSALPVGQASACHDRSESCPPKGRGCPSRAPVGPHVGPTPQKSNASRVPKALTPPLPLPPKAFTKSR